MRYTRNIFITFVVALVLSFAFKAYTQETKQETKPEAADTAIQKTTSVAAEGKSDDAKATHDHLMGTEKRYVATIGTDGVQHKNRPTTGPLPAH